VGSPASHENHARPIPQRDEEKNMNRYVAGLAFSEDGTRVALIRKNRPLWQIGFLNAIGGHIETKKREPANDTARQHADATSAA
jgi:hypothetical protein